MIEKECIDLDNVVASASIRGKGIIRIPIGLIHRGNGMASTNHFHRDQCVKGSSSWEWKMAAFVGGSGKWRHLLLGVENGGNF